MTVKAIYENGILRPLEPLEIDEGTRVQVIVPTDGVSPCSGRADRRTAAQVLAAIAALPPEGDDSPFPAADHDRILYGEEGSAG